nr:NB-ARC domain-containing protein [Streptomyces sp. HNM0574]
MAPEQVPDEEDERVRRYRSLLDGRRMLILLDNAASAEQVRPLLPGTSTCRVLVTSRNRLGGLVAREGAQPLELPVLAPHEARALLVAALGEQRVAADVESAEQLARLCGHLPLALRIAAARLACEPGLRIADLAAELAAGDRLRTLELDDDPSSAVRAAFAQSYGALDPEARRLFRLLSLVPGPEVTAPVAAVLLKSDEGDAGRLLRTLSAGHLLHSPARGRYGLHDLLREYGAERARREIPPPEQAAAADRLNAHYLRTARAAAARGYSPVVRLPREPGIPDGDGSRVPAPGGFPATTRRWSGWRPSGRT